MRCIIILVLTSFLLSEYLPIRGDSVSIAPKAFPFSEIGQRAGLDYQGDAIGMRTIAEGASLWSRFQKLSATVDRTGLELQSTEAEGGRLRLMARTVRRFDGEQISLPNKGQVETEQQPIRFIRPGLVEEYSVSVDGVRQDFIVLQSPQGSGDLCLELSLDGAVAEPISSGVQIKMNGSGRHLSYQRLKVSDAGGRSLQAFWEVSGTNQICIRVADAGAQYPVRIDPTFSDTDWVGTGGTLSNQSPLWTDGTIYSFARIGTSLYVGGTFTTAGGVTATNIAMWDGSKWSTLGSGIDGPVYALAVSGTNIYAGGLFTTAGGVTASNVAKWNGSTWSALGNGTGGTVSALALSGTVLYVGGTFTTAGSVSVSNIAKWDGSTWSDLGGGVNNSVYALVYNGALYAGGSFTTAGGISAKRVAKWSGNAWSALADGVNGQVSSIIYTGGYLYVGGRFTATGYGDQAGGLARYNLAWNGGGQWDGTSTDGLGANGYANTLVVNGGYLYVGGSFTSTKGLVTNISVNRVLCYNLNNAQLSTFGSGIEGGDVYALAVWSDTNLFVGGNFNIAGGATANRIAQWDGTSWSASGSGLNSSVAVAAVVGTNLYVGGGFTAAENTSVSRIAQWNGSAWSALGSGVNSGVNALAVMGNHLFVGGGFTTAGGISANRIAKWDGTTWSSLGSGLNGSVSAMVVSETNLYAGGAFTAAGDVLAVRIAKWDGTTWSVLGTGVNGTVYTMVMVGTNLYAGGVFTTAGGISANRIAKWDGRTWSALGSGLNGDVYELAVLGTDLYVGGAFTTAGGSSASGIAKWDGSSWSALGSGVVGNIYALEVVGNDLYAGGAFTTAGGISANRIAKWDGNTWSALGSGLNGDVYDLVLSPTGLYVGGNFSVVGSRFGSPYFAEALVPLPAPTVAAVSLSGGFTGGGTALTVTGTGFSPTATVTLGGTAATEVVWVSSTSLMLKTPAHAAGLVNVVVTNPDTQSGTGTGLYTYAPPPTVTGVSLSGGPLEGGTLLTVTGTGFSSMATVTLGGTAATEVVWVSSTSLMLTTPAHAAGLVNVVVTNPDTQSGTGTGLYTYAVAPTVSAVSRSTGSSLGGDSVTISGSGFQANAVVTLGGIAAGSVVWTSSSRLTVVTPAHAIGLVDVVVTNPDTQSGTGTGLYTYAVAPTVTGLSVVQGPIAGGTVVTISGTGFKATPVVTFGGTVATSVVWKNATTLTVVTPGHAAGAAAVVVTNPDTLSAVAPEGFSYDGPPTVTSLSVSGGALSGGTEVAVYGTGFLGGLSVYLGGEKALSVMRINGGKVKLVTPAHAAGAVDVVVVNPDGQSVTNKGAYLYAVAPKVKSLSLTSGSTAGEDVLYVTGSGFQATPKVSFGGKDARKVIWNSATLLKVVTPSHTAGVVDVVVTNPDNQNDSLNNAYTYTPSFPVTGSAIDGYVANAVVWFDANLNGVVDADEPATRTDRSGKFTLDVSTEVFDRNQNGIIDPEEGRLVCEGGIDLSTGEPAVGQWTAPVGAKVVTPLTSLIEALMRSTPGTYWADAEEQVCAGLSLPSSSGLKEFDPVAAAQRGERSAVAVHVAAASVADTVAQLTRVLNGLPEARSDQQVAQVVIQALAKQVAGGSTVPLGSSEGIKTLLKEAGSQLNGSLPDAWMEIVTGVVSYHNQAKQALLAEEGDPLKVLQRVAQVQVVAQGDTASTLAELVAGKRHVDEVMIQFSHHALHAAITNAPMGDLTGTVALPGTFSLHRASGIATEDGRAVEGLSVVRRDGSLGMVRVQLEVSGPAGLLKTNRLEVEFADGQLKRSIDYKDLFRDDIQAQGDQSATVTLSLGAGAPSEARVGTITQAVVRVLDNEGVGTVAFTESSYEISEDGSSLGPVVLERSGGAEGKVVVMLHLSGGTSQAEDYTTPAMVIFNSGEVRKVVHVPVVDDQQEEETETVKLKASATTVGGLMLGTSSTQVTILDNDAVVPLVPGQLEWLVVEGTTPQLRIRGKSGAKHQLEVSADLQSWSPHSANAITTNGENTPVDVDIGTSNVNVRFFRLVPQP